MLVSLSCFRGFTFHGALLMCQNTQVNVILPLSVFVYFADQQFLLKRLADAAIDIYGMAAVLSRY